MRSIITLIAVAMAFLGGCGTPSLLITPVSNVNELVETTVQDGQGWRPRKIVIIPIEGLIMNSRSTGLLGSGENSVSVLKQQLDKAAGDSSVAAIVLRINSPGGTVTASDTMYQLVRDFRRKSDKPVIASVQDVAASGGYYIAMASDQIVAQPTSIVGSIGVIFTTLDFEGTLGKIGARSHVIKSGTMKDMASPLKGMTPAEREIIQSMIMEDFARFQQVVKERRQLTNEQLAAVSDGRIFSGQQAVTLKLADQLGTLEDAIEIAKKKSHSLKACAVLYVRPFGYSGSIYASNQLPAPESHSTQIQLPLIEEALPAGFYFVWRPGW